MAKVLWDEAIKRGLRAYANQNKPGKRIRYLYGAKGEYITRREQVEWYFAAEQKYFSKYTDKEKEEIIHNIIKDGGAYCYDCSGFVGWVCTGDKQYSYGQYLNSERDQSGNIKEYSLAEGVGGSILFTTFGGTGRHIGMDVSYGGFLHAAYDPTDAREAKGMGGIVYQRFTDNEVAWEHSTRSNMVDYTGADNR